MAEAIGLTLGGLSVAALFSTCIECFDIIVAAQECSEEYEQLCALLGLQRLRFEIWGESVGLPSGRFDHEPVIPYNTALDRPQVRPHIERALENIRHLLDNVTAIDARYGVTSISQSEDSGTTLRGINIFKKSYDRLKSRIRINQREKTTWKTARWALHDASQFSNAISRLTSLIDGLVHVTSSLGLLEQRYEVLRMHTEINNITNEEDLELLSEAASKHSGSSIHQTVSDSASRRLDSVVAASMLEAKTKTQAGSDTCRSSFHTAKTKPSEHSVITVDSSKLYTPSIALEPIPEGDSKEGKTKFVCFAKSSTSQTSSAPNQHGRYCAECQDDQLQCFVAEDATSCSNCIERRKQCSFDLTACISIDDSDRDDLSPENSLSAPERQSIPQHERLFSEIFERAKQNGSWAPKTLSFEAGDAHYGDRLSPIKHMDEDHCINHTATMLNKADRGTSAAKRMYYELRFIRKGLVPFISAAPLEDNLDKVLASIEGPPETPYEGGVFWIMVRTSQREPPGPPLIRFHTKIYHPNISPTTGNICADYQEKWSSAEAPSSIQGYFKESSTFWSQRKSPDMWSLSALLIAICGLLATPNVNDPLIPEIAQKYIEDYKGYYSAAKLWTQRYATSEKPREIDLVFPEEPMDSRTLANTDNSIKVSKELLPVDLVESRQQYLRQSYDEKFVGATGFSGSASPPLPDQDNDNAELPSSSDGEAGESDPERQKIGSIILSFLKSRGEHGHKSQMAGERLSKLEQWRMIRDVRLEIEKSTSQNCAQQTPSARAKSMSLRNDDIRSLMASIAKGELGARDTARASTYFGIVMRSMCPSLTSPSRGWSPTSRDEKQKCVNRRNTRSDSPHCLPTPNSRRIPALSGPSPSSSPSTSRPLSDFKSPPFRIYSPYSSSPRAYPSPRYSNTGYYSTRAVYTSPSGEAEHASVKLQTRGKSWSAPPLKPIRRFSQSYRVSYGDSEEDEYYVYDGRIYVVPGRQLRRESYYKRYGHHNNHYYQGFTYGRDSTPIIIAEPSGFDPDPPRRSRRQSTSTPARPRPSSSSKKSPPPPSKATEADARRHRIPPGYSLKNWDPAEEPISLLGSVFDANSLGKWIYDWTVRHHGLATPISDMAGELWLLLIQLAGTVKRAEECMPHIRSKDDREMVEDFIESGDRLTDKLKKLLKTCETPMLKAGKRHREEQAQLRKNAGIEFVDSIFGRDRQLENTEKLMASMRLWNLRFDSTCGDILRKAHIDNSVPSKNWPKEKPRKLPIEIRSHFGLEDIQETDSEEMELDVSEPESSILTLTTSRGASGEEESRSQRGGNETPDQSISLAEGLSRAPEDDWGPW